MKKLLSATAALAMFAAFAAMAQPEGKIQLAGQVLAPTACRAESATIRNPAEFKLVCAPGIHGAVATPVQRVSIEALRGSDTAYLIQITYL